MFEDIGVLSLEPFLRSSDWTRTRPFLRSPTSRAAAFWRPGWYLASLLNLKAFELILGRYVPHDYERSKSRGGPPPTTHRQPWWTPLRWPQVNHLHSGVVQHRTARRNPQHTSRFVWVRPAKGGSRGPHAHANGEQRERVDHPKNWEILLSDGLLALLGLDDGLGGVWLGAGVYTGDRPVNFASRKILWVHLEELNTADINVDGAPSTLLAGIGLGRHAFGDINTTRIECPEFKRLRNGTVGEWKVSIKDATTGKALSNHDLPIHVTLEVVRK